MTSSNMSTKIESICCFAMISSMFNSQPPRSCWLRSDWSLHNANYLSDDTLEDPFRIELRSNSGESFEVLSITCQLISSQQLWTTLTPGSKFFTDWVNTSLEFFVQCGRHGNSFMRVALKLWSETRVSCNLELLGEGNVQKGSLNLKLSPQVGL